MNKFIYRQIRFDSNLKIIKEKLYVKVSRLFLFFASIKYYIRIYKRKCVIIFLRDNFLEKKLCVK